MKSERIIVCGDFHLPYQDRSAVAAFIKYAEEWKADTVVVGGDIIDCEAVSRFLKDPRKVASLQKEFDEGRKLMKELGRLGKRRIALEGNHEIRVSRYLLRNAPALCDLRCLDIREQLGASDWEWTPYPAFKRLGRLVVLHGESYGPATNQKHLAKFGGFNVASGHSHRIAQDFCRSLHGVVSAVQWGCLSHLSPHYTHHPNWQTGFATFENGQLQTHFISKGKVLT